MQCRNRFGCGIFCTKTHPVWGDIAKKAGKAPFDLTFVRKNDIIERNIIYYKLR